MNIQELWILMVLINMKMQMYTWDSQTPLWVDSGWWSMTPLPAKLLVASHTSNWWHSHLAYQGTDCKMEQPTCQSKQLLNKKLCSLSLSLSLLSFKNLIMSMFYLAESFRRLFIGCRHITICKLLFTLATKNFIGSTDRLGNSLFMAGPMAWKIVRKNV